MQNPAGNFDETRPYPARFPFPHAETKAAAERLVLAADAPGFAALALRPCFVWGPRDNSVLPALRRMAEAGDFVWLDRGRARVSTTHVANLVGAVELALTRGRGGQAYFVADEDDRQIHEFLTGLADASGFALPERSVPSALARPAARALESIYRALGRQAAPPVTAMAVSLMSSAVTVRTDKAAAELGYAPRISVEAGLQQLAV